MSESDLKRQISGSDPEVAPLDTCNAFGITAHSGLVVMLLRPAQHLAPDVALQLASWLIVAAELANHPQALETAVATVKAIRNT